ncbi:MAG: hypothetical protein H0T79_07695 [Deltaproteobacteria bacterium]|nr:hypothetical protein [Deltaproteobacteria bacterium]
MRAAFAVLAVTACLASCESRYGAYLVVDGAPSDIAFDRVELFFGHGDAGAIPQTPLSPATEGRRFTRQFTPADELALDAPAHSVEFYLPEDAKQVGRYIAVVAFKGDQPVGVGEVFGYEIPSGTIYQYVIELEPWSPDAERWGDPSGPACLRWTRERGSQPLTLAVVRDGDSDCDGVPQDCQDLEFCAAGMNCTTSGAACFVNGEAGCMIGTCVEGTGCVPHVCSIPGTCDATCEGFTELTDRLTCALNEVALDHIAVLIPVDAAGKLCPEATLRFLPPSPGIGCHDPIIEAPLGGVFPDVKMTIAAGTIPPEGGPLPCVLEILALNPVFVGDHHLLISIGAVDDPNIPAPVPLQRWSFVIGVQPAAPVDCSALSVARVEGTGAVMTCRP